MSLPQDITPPPPRPGRFEKLLVLLSTGLGVGRVKKAPGTVGSLWGPLMIFGLQQVSGHPLFMLLCGIVLYLIGIPICAAGIRHYQSGDPKHVVFDEIAAFPFVYLLIPLTWSTAILGYLLFRWFDITKPWPVRRFEKFPGAWGVMSDDMVAGLIAGFVLVVVRLFTGPF